MGPISLISKLQTVFNLVISKNLYLFILAIVVILIILFITTNGSNKKQSKKAYLLLYIALFIFVIFEYGQSITSLVDYAINEVFITYYFPNIVIYLLMLLITNIILFKTIFSDKTSSKIKILNATSFGIIIYLFILAIISINNLNLDVFNITELYSSNSIRSILELSMFIFIFWITLLFVYYLIRKYQYKKGHIKEEIITNYNIINNIDLSKPYKYEIVKEEKLIPKKEQEQYINPNFTLEEYKLIAKILKEEQEKKQLIVENPLTELNRLYQSIKD